MDRRALLQAAGAVSLYGVLGPLPALAQPGIVHRSAPLNAETGGLRLRSSFVTQQGDFYIRNHGTIPRLSAESYVLTIVRPGVPPTKLTLAELKRRFPERTIAAVMQCAGNRRSDMHAFKAVSGDPWGATAIGNALWSGVGLGDVLKAAGVEANPAHHVAFEGADTVEEDGTSFNYGVSIPLAKAMAAETLLAYAMNGEVLTAEHGFPLRVVTPGFAGARSPKWLTTITIQDHPSDNRIQQKSYKLFGPEVTRATADAHTGTVINEMPMNSAICEPTAGATVSSSAVTVRGYAIATASKVVRVDVSTDGGRSWKQAELDQRPDSPWSWTFWSLRVNLAKGEHELVVRAWDDAGRTQPENLASIWNHRGYLTTAWHRIHVRVG